MTAFAARTERGSRVGRSLLRQDPQTPERRRPGKRSRNRRAGGDGAGTGLRAMRPPSQPPPDGTAPARSSATGTHLRTGGRSARARPNGCRPGRPTRAPQGDGAGATGRRAGGTSDGRGRQRACVGRNRPGPMRRASRCAAPPGEYHRDARQSITATGPFRTLSLQARSADRPADGRSGGVGTMSRHSGRDNRKTVPGNERQARMGLAAMPAPFGFGPIRFGLMRVLADLVLARRDEALGWACGGARVDGWRGGAGRAEYRFARWRGGTERRALDHGALSRIGWRAAGRNLRACGGYDGRAGRDRWRVMPGQCPCQIETKLTRLTQSRA